MIRSSRFGAPCIAFLPMVAGQDASRSAEESRRPDIVFVIAEDCSWLHFGAYGSEIVATPAIDRLAEEGVLFTHAYVSEPTCSPSRAAILTGQAFWRLEDASVFGGTLKKSFPVFPRILEEAGYHLGRHGPAWKPGSWQDGGWEGNPGGPKVPGLRDFLRTAPAGKPVCFWEGSRFAHRPFESRGARRSRRAPGEVQVPPFLPDRAGVRGDLLGYFGEIEAFDRRVGQILDLLDATGRAENTIVVVTSDHGMAFPRGKGNLYDHGVRVPLLIRWPKRIAGGRTVSAFVSLTDLAPTFLEAAGLEPDPAMTGRSLLGLLLPSPRGPTTAREHAVFGREIGQAALQKENRMRGSPCRGIRDRRYLYIRNYDVERGAMNPTSRNFGPAAAILSRERARDPEMSALYELCFGARPEEELYDCSNDPFQLENLADSPSHAKVKEELRARLERHLVRTGDPRALGRGDVFLRYDRFGDSRPVEAAAGD